MKLRLKLGSRRLSIVLPQTTAQSSLQSARQHITECGLARGTCELSLNGTDVLDETRSLAELGIVSGDLLHVLCRDENDEQADLPSHGLAGENFQPSPPQEENLPQEMEEGDISSDVATISEPECQLVPDTMSHYQDFCQSLLRLVPEKNASQPRVELTQTATLCTALHSLMLDAGFTPVENGHLLNDTSAKWTYKTPVNDEVRVHLACLKMGHLLGIHGMAKIKEEKVTVSLSLQVPIHVGRDTKTGVWILLKPAELALFFKDQVAHRLLTNIRTVLGLPEVGTFSSLFPELKLLVCRTLDLKSLLALSAASKELHTLCHDPYLWKHLLLRDFRQRRMLPASKSNLSWKQLYIEHFKKAVERERLTQHSSLIFPLVPPDLLPLFTPPPPYPFPLMIGGGHDLLPQVPEHLHLGGEFPPLHHRRRHHPEIRDHMIQPLLRPQPPYQQQIKDTAKRTLIFDAVLYKDTSVVPNCPSNRRLQPATRVSFPRLL